MGSEEKAETRVNGIQDRTEVQLVVMLEVPILQRRRAFLWSAQISESERKLAVEISVNYD